MLAALGDYGDAADPTLLTARKTDAHPTGTADLRGMRLAVLHEGDAGRHLAEGTVKRLTGGDRIKARRMNEDFWSFEPSHTFLMLTNYKPLVSGTDEGIWRRLRLIPWDVVIPPQERDEELGDRLAQEVDAVLMWLVSGYQSWAQIGLADPKQVVAATDDYRAESDALGRFLAERTMPHGTVGSGELFAAWSAWCKTEGHEPGTNKAMTGALEARGYDKRKANSGVRWLQLGLCAEEEL